MQFPKDHFWHPEEFNAEWLYFWGRLENGDWFHFVEHHYKFAGIRTDTIHYSLNGKFKDEIVNWNEDIYSNSGYTHKRFSFQQPELGLTFIPTSKPVPHRTNFPRRNYYSIPHMKGEGHLKGEEIKATAWFDHEFSDFHKFIPKWDWVSIQLDKGIYIMAWNSSIEKSCDISIDGKTVYSDFVLNKKYLYVNDLGMKILIEPIFDEIIFDPRLGIKYSEQPFEAIFNGKKIGIGMREKTHHKEKTYE